MMMVVATFMFAPNNEKERLDLKLHFIMAIKKTDYIFCGWHFHVVLVLTKKKKKSKAVFSRLFFVFKTFFFFFPDL